MRQLPPFIAQNLVVGVHVAALGMALRFGWGGSDGASGCGGEGELGVRRIQITNINNSIFLQLQSMPKISVK